MSARYGRQPRACSTSDTSTWVPRFTIDGKYDPFTPAGDGRSYRTQFTGKYRHRTFDVGHNVPQEAPGEFARAVVDAARL